MKPYYQDNAVTIYHGDCRDIMPQLGMFDLCLTDPPYGLGERMKGGTWGGSGKYDKMREWDQESADIDFLLKLNIPCIIWGGNYFKVPPSRCWLSWSKVNVVATMASMELAWTNLDKPAKEWRGPVGQHKDGHPTQKPLALMLWCISLCPDNPQTIIDPFAGVCTTGKAAKDRGLKCVCIEREERYCEAGAKRLAQEVMIL